MSQIFWAAPPIAKTLAAATFVLSLLVYSHAIPFQSVNLDLTTFLKLPPQLWRIFTSLLITGPNFAILFDTFFLYVYGAKLETASPRFSQRADFFTYIVFVCLVILGLNALIVGGTVFASALALAFICTSTKDDWGQRITFFVVEMPVQWLPYAFLLVTFVVVGPTAAMIQATGLVASHLYDFLTGLYPAFGPTRSLITTPDFLRGIFGTRLVTDRPYGTAFQPAQRAGSEPSWGLSWAKFGPGHTLGGEGTSAAQRRPRGCLLAVMVMTGFVALSCLLGFLFIHHRDPDGTLAAFKSAIGIGEVSSVTTPFKRVGSSPI